MDERVRGSVRGYHCCFGRLIHGLSSSVAGFGLRGRQISGVSVCSMLMLVHIVLGVEGPLIDARDVRKVPKYQWDGS